MKLTFYILIIGVTVFEILADFLFKKWTLMNNRLFLAFGILSYLVSTVIWAFSLREESLSKAIAMFTILSLILIVLMGVFVFNEHLSGWNILGIALGVVSIILISI
jgi:multidrug transporter EmrE-like cation transporter